jgi:hypothetical protein
MMRLVMTKSYDTVLTIIIVPLTLFPSVCHVERTNIVISTVAVDTKSSHLVHTIDTYRSTHIHRILFLSVQTQFTHGVQKLE